MAIDLFTTSPVGVSATQIKFLRILFSRTLLAPHALFFLGDIGHTLVLLDPDGGASLYEQGPMSTTLLAAKPPLERARVSPCKSHIQVCVVVQIKEGGMDGATRPSPSTPSTATTRRRTRTCMCASPTRGWVSPWPMMKGA